MMNNHTEKSMQNQGTNSRVEAAATVQMDGDNL
jgi:hypothetical protein